MLSNLQLDSDTENEGCNQAKNLTGQRMLQLQTASGRAAKSML